MDNKELTEQIIAVLAEEFEVDADQITPESSLKDTLGLDSLDLVDVVVLVDQNFGVTLTASDFVGIVTFSDFINLIERKQNEKAGK